MRGFTIIELLMVIAIITILPVIVISNFPRVKLQFALSRAAHAFSQDARLAQDMALSSLPHKDSFGISQKVGGYGIYLDTTALGNKTYLIYADRLPANNRYDASDVVVRKIDMQMAEPGVVIKGLGNVFLDKVSIHFSVGNAGVFISQLDDTSSGVEIIFALESDAAKTKSVFINTSGLIEIRN